MVENVPYYSSELARENTNKELLAYQEVTALLGDARLAEEIKTGNVTLAMIRPNVGPEANVFGLTDNEAADTIEGMIEGLGEMAKFSFHFTPEAAREFYEGGPEASMRNEAPIDSTRYETRWPEFIDFMTSGPTTAILLYSPTGDAISRWRAHLGHWNIDQVRDMNTIRGKLGVNKYNNLVHGSDSPESVLRELAILSRCLTAPVSDPDIRQQA